MCGFATRSTITIIDSSVTLKMVFDSGLSLSQTTKFSVWTPALEEETPSPLLADEQPVNESLPPGEDPNSSLALLGGTFAMWMFADDGNPSDQMELPPPAATSSSSSLSASSSSDAAAAACRPSAISLLHAVALGGGDTASPHAFALADQAYWKSLDESTKALYGDGQGLEVGGKLRGRAPKLGAAAAADAAGYDADAKRLKATLLDVGYAVVPPPRAQPKLSPPPLTGGGDACFDWDEMARAVRTVGC
jgi:hypothetical protein